MSLIIELKAGERAVIGEAIVQNLGRRTRLRVLGQAPVLREKDVMRWEDADSPCKQLYLCVSLMYLGDQSSALRETCLRLEGDIGRAAPSMAAYLAGINENIIAGSYYRALKDARKLIDYEQRLIDHEQQRESGDPRLRQHGASGD